MGSLQMMTAVSRFERGTSFASHGQMVYHDVGHFTTTKVKDEGGLNFCGLRAGEATKFIGTGIDDYPTDRRHCLSFPRHSTISPHHLLSCYNISPLNLTILFNSRTINMTERSNQTDSSCIAERPSLRIAEQRSMVRVVIMVQETSEEGV